MSSYIYYYRSVILALFWGAMTLLASTPAELAKKHVAYGNVAIEDADYQRAVEHYENALKAQPESKTLIYSLGVLYLKTGQTQKAIPLFTRYLELFPLDRDGLVALSNAYIMEGEFTKAERLLSRAFSADKKDEAVRRNLGFAQLQLGKTDEAIKTLEALIQDFPSNRLTRLDLSLAYAAKGEIDQALGTAKKALEEYPDPEGKIIYSDLLSAKGGALVAEARDFFRKNEMEKAIGILEPLCRQYPNYADAQILLGHSLNLKMPPEREKAEKAYRAVLEARRFVPVAPTDLAIVYDNLGSILLRSGKVKEAESFYRLGIAEESDYAPVYFNFGLLRAVSNAPTEASLAFMEAVRRDSAFAEYIENHPKLQKFRATSDYTNLINSIKKELKKNEPDQD